jgi:hypothetical protein
MENEMNSHDQLQAVLEEAITLRATPPNFKSKLAGQWRAAVDGSTRTGSELFDLIIEICEVAHTNQHANDPTLVKMQNWVLQLDASPNPDWAQNTSPNTRQRRTLICELLELEDAEIAKFETIFKPFLEGNIAIAQDHEPWYTDERKLQSAYYWPSILNYLRNRGIPEESIVSVDQASDQVMDFIADPMRNEIRAARGLVVGYVQSGKTTNINVLVGKAIDSGYRLIIILAGLTDVLRTQTQRRLDKEVVGKVLLKTDPAEGEGDGYLFSNDWQEFIEHAPFPGNPVGPPIERLTTRKFDFSSVRGGSRFQDDWVQAGRSARIVVIKKNATRLKTLITELEKMSSSVRSGLPAIVIDDESDQASVNTNNLIDDPDNERSKTNDRIVSLLKVLPRAQYIGYTATPFANVFINPDDPMDLFPIDFVYSLTQPVGYMGVRDFHDLDSDFLPIEDVEPEFSNKAKHVRDISSGRNDVVQQALRTAIDTHVLTGAIKLYRETTLGIRFRHHTFFLTDSPKVADHEEARKKIVSLWEGSNFHSSEGLSRLEEIYASDVLLNSDRKDDPAYFPESFVSLIPFIESAIQKMNRPFDGYAPTLIVNGTPRSVAPDFEMDEIWKFIVGGAKLSRGYTIEGLTTTFFRRRTTAQDTLLQMGRWFGYRNHYRDLVRLYISRSEGSGARELDLYKAFESVCRDEEAFRQELRRYAEIQPDGSRIKPRDIPPLVQNSHPKLMPVQKNKMWNARLTSRNFGGQLKSFEGSSINSGVLSHNANLFRELASSFEFNELFLDSAERNRSHSAVIDHDSMSQFLCNFQRDVISPQERLFRDFLKDERNEIKDWVLLLPQMIRDSGVSKWDVGSLEKLTKVGRTWNSEEKSFGPIGESRHRFAAYEIANIVAKIDVSKTSSAIHELAKTRHRGVVLLYPIATISDRKTKRPMDEDHGIVEDAPPIGTEIFLPSNSMPAARFEPIRREAPDAIVVDAPK